MPGDGPRSPYVFIGQNPGNSEDLEGRPFVGPAGRILTKFLGECGLKREDVFITNLILCHTYDDRAPVDVEIKTCASIHLKAYLKYIKPILVVTLGAPAARYVGGIKSLKKDHGRIYVHRAGFYLIPVYHPAAVLHNGNVRVDLEFDAYQVRAFIDNEEEFRRRLQERRANTVDQPSEPESLNDLLLTDVSR